MLLRKLLGVLVLMAASVVCASATDITIQSFNISNVHSYSGVIKLRVYYTGCANGSNFMSSDGQVVFCGAVGSSTGFYREVSVTLAGTTLTIPAFTLVSTDDSSQLTPRATAVFFANNARRENLFSNYVITATLGTPITFLQLFNYQPGAVPSPPPVTYLTAAQISALITASVGSLNKANVSPTYGVTALTAPPSNAADPLAVSPRDPRMGSSFNPSGYPYLAGCDGSLGSGDTTAFTTLITAMGNSGTIKLQRGSICELNNITIPAGVTLDFSDGGRIAVQTGQTVTILGPIVAPTAVIFGNAAAGQGTISLVGNKAVRAMSVRWWGATADGTTDDGPAIQAALHAASYIGGCTVDFLSGIHHITFTMTVGQTTGGGDGLGDYSTVNLRGVGGFGTTTGSYISYTGATNLPVFKITRGRFNHIEDIYLINSAGSRGSTVGFLETGPAVSMQTHGVHYERVTVTGFFKGIESGDAAVGVGGSASEALLFTAGSINDCTYGFYANSNFNSLNFTFVQTAFQGNNYGIYTATGFRVSVLGCAGGQNLVDFYISGTGNVFIVDGWDCEQSTKFLQLINSTKAVIHSVIFRFTLLTRTERSAVIESGTSDLSVDNFYMHTANTPSAGATGPHFVYSTGGSLDIRNCSFPDDQLPHISAVSSESNLTSYRFWSNRSIDNTTAAVIARFPDETGIILWSTGTQADKMSFTHLLGSGFASTPYTPAQVTSNQNNYTLPVGGYSLFVRLSTDASRNFTGLATTSPVQYTGQMHYLWNVGGFDVVLKHQDGASTAANRFLNTTGADITLTANQQALCVYDGTTLRWRCSKLN